MKTLSTKVPDDLKEQIEEVADENENTRSDQARQLLRAGLDEYRAGDAIPTGFVWAGLGSLLIGSAIDFTALPDLWPLLGVAFFLGGLAWEHSTVRATLSKLRTE